MSITRETAEAIARKLHAVLNEKKNRPHDLYVIYHNNLRIASFGVRRSSKKDKGHGHVPKDIHVSPHQASQLGQCTMSYDEWIQLMREKGVIPR